ncbi:unnamed protein product [Lymnaea stagnalis]|uniref:Protein F37C4.5 n=1 Tax=Lymnaea stagnalis TaxID=6523 RepID=A0AAV2IPF1_LYMST
MADQDEKTSINLISVKASECPVTRVTVYKDRAEVFRELETTVKAGVNELRIKEFVRIDEDSIRVEGKGNATIAEVSYQNKYVTEDEATMTEKEKVLNEQVLKNTALLLEEQKVLDLENQKKSLNKQWQLLDQFAATAAKNGQGEKKDEPSTFLLDAGYFKGMREFMQQYKDIGKQLEAERLDLEKKNEELNKKIEAVERNLSEVRGNYHSGHENRECVVVLEAEKETKVSLTVSYVVLGASWTPSYDLRMFTEKSVLKIFYYGLIFQSSGEDWNNVKLYLSTAEPSVGGTIPNLPMTQLSVRKIRYQPRKFSLRRSSRKSKARSEAFPVEKNDAEEFRADGMLGCNFLSIAPVQVSLRLACQQTRSCSAFKPQLLSSYLKPAAVDFVAFLQDHKKNFFYMISCCKLTGLEREKTIPKISRMDKFVWTKQSIFFFPSLRTVEKAKGKMYAAREFNYDLQPMGRCAEPEALNQELECMRFSAPMLPSEVAENTTSTTYEIARQSTIPSDNTEHKVTVAIIELTPTLNYLTVPKIVPHAFLQAKVTNTSQYTLLPGRTNIFLDNSFVAKAEIKAVAPKEEFECSLGVDPSVRVEYKPLVKVNSSSGIISKSQIITHEQAIEIKNLHDYLVKVQVRDNLPRSLDEKIKVNLILPNIDVKHPEKSEKVRLTKGNNVEWDLELKGLEKTEVVLKYSVEHPANEDLETTQAFGN